MPLLQTRLLQARELYDAIASLLTTFAATEMAGLIGAARSFTLYKIMMQIQDTLSVGFLGSEEVLDEMDALVADDAAEATRNTVDGITRHAVSILMEHYDVLTIETQMLNQGRASIADLMLLNIAMLQRISDLTEAVPCIIFAADHACVRAYGLVAVEEMRTRPISQWSVHAAMNALHAIYRSTTSTPYCLEFEHYARHVVRRVLYLLTVPGQESVWNVDEYREKLAGSDATYRYSQRYLQTVTIIWHAIMDYFDLAYVVPIEANPFSVYRPSAQEHDLARNWLQRRVSTEQEVWPRDMLMGLSLYAGEKELYMLHHRGQHPVHALILREHRTADYYRLTLAAPRPSNVVVHEQLGSPQIQHLHLALVVLATLKARIKAAVPALDPEAFVVVHPELRVWATLMKLNPRRPIMVLLYGHLQVWFGGKMLMYNNIFDALAAWMWAVETQCDRRLQQHPAGDLVDDFYRPTELPHERLARIAMFHGTEMPRMGCRGVY